MERQQVERVLRQVPGIAERVEWLQLRDRLIAVLERVTQEPHMVDEVPNLETHLKDHVKRSSQLVLSERHLSTLAARHAALLASLEARCAAVETTEDTTELDEAKELLEKLRAVAPTIADMPPLVSVTSQPTVVNWRRIIGSGFVIGLVVGPVLGQAMSLTAAAVTVGIGAATIYAAPKIAASPLLKEVWEFAAKLQESRGFLYTKKKLTFEGGDTDGTNALQRYAVFSFLLMCASNLPLFACKQWTTRSQR